MAIYDQGTDDEAKPSTRYLARGASVTALTTDLSQFLTNLTAGTSSVYETTTTRMNHAGPRTIGVRVDMTSAHTGTLYRHGSGASTERLEFSAANTVRCVVNNTALTGLAVTAPTGTDTCIIAWLTEANPDTTGAGDAYRSMIKYWNVTDGNYSQTDWLTHAAITSSSTTAVFGADDSAGAAAFAGTMTACWYEHRVQSGAEIGNDWVSAITAPTTECTDDHQGIPPQASTLDVRNMWHGPSMVWAGDATRRMVRRCLSPFWNEMLNVQPTWTYATLTADDPFVRGAPGASTYRMPLGLRRLVPIPDVCTHAWVRIHVRSWATDANAVAVAFRVYSFSRFPGASLPPEDQGAADPLTAYYVQATITRDDDASAGQWTTLGLLPIARGRTGAYRDRSVFAIAIACPNDAQARIMVRGIHVVPAFVDQVGGLDFGEGG